MVPTNRREDLAVHPRSHALAGATFAALALQLRGRTGLTQREIAARLGVHVHSVQLWEAATNRPNARRLQMLVECFLESEAFTIGREVEEAEALWTAAIRESPRLTTPFDTAWLTRLLETRAARQQPSAATPNASTRVQQSWGNAPDVDGFLSRHQERATLQRWILEDRCRIVGVLGMGGIGKTQLATRVARDVAHRFHHVYWRSLQNAPTFSDWLEGAIRVVSPGDPVLSAADPKRLDRLFELINGQPTLFVIDNIETVLQPGDDSGQYLPGYAAYGDLLKLLAEAAHPSCVLLTSREEPPEFRPVKGSVGPVRTCTLSGLGTEAIQQLLRDKSLQGNATAWARLVEAYGGNGLALKIVGETIRELFGGYIEAFLMDLDGPRGGVGGVRHLLDAQIGRLSHLEQRVLRWMAVEREPVSFGEIAAELGDAAGRGPVREATAALLRRSLLERHEPGPMFVLQPVILEHVTEQLSGDTSRELANGSSAGLRQQPLLKATAKDFVRQAQERLILGPIIRDLRSHLGSQQAVERRLVQLLGELRTLPREEQGYGPGNLINLLRLVRGDLRRLDLSGLLVRQVYLDGLAAQDADLTATHVLESVLPEGFHSMSVTLSAGGAHLVVGTSGGAVCLRRVSDRSLLLSMLGHAGSVWRVALSRDERLVVSASEDGTARVWDASSGQPVFTLKGHTDFVQGVALADDHLLATASQDGTVKLWHPITGELIRNFESPGGGVLSVALTRDGALLVAGTRAGTIAFWDVATGLLRNVLQAHSASIPGLALSTRGTMLASASLDGTAKLWDAHQQTLRMEFVGHTGAIWDIRLARSDALAATAGDDGTVRLWSTDDGQLLTTLVGHEGAVWNVSLNEDGTRVASAGQDGTVRVSDARTGASLATLQGHTAALRDVALSADGRVVASGRQDGTITVWDATNGRMRGTLGGHSASISGVALSQDASILASASQDGTLKVWDVENRQLRCTLTGHTGTVWDVALSGDGRLAASCSYDGTVKLWDTGQGVLLSTLHGHSQGVRGVALNDALGLVVSASQDGSLIVWDARSGGARARLSGHPNSVQSVAIDRGGRLVASAGFDGTVKLWDAASGVCVRELVAHSGGALCVGIADDEELLVTGGFDRTVKLWRMQTGELVKTLHGHMGAVWGVSLNAGATILASGSFDGTIKLWDLVTGACRHTLQPERPFERVKITGLTGITAAQRAGLTALGALDDAFESVEDQPIETLV